MADQPTASSAPNVKAGSVQQPQRYDPTKEAAYQETPIIRQLRQQVADRQKQIQGGSADPGKIQYWNDELGNEQKQLNSAITYSSRGLDATGKAFAPEFDSQIDPATGLLKSQYQLSDRGPVTADQTAINAIRQQGLGEGPSKYATLAEQKQRMGEQDLLNNARQQMSGQQAQSQAALAMNGGLSSGARERLAESGNNNAVLQMQGINRQGQTDRLNIGLQDQQFKNDALKSTANYDMLNADQANKNRQYSTGIQGQNLAAAGQEINAARQWKNDKYNANLQAWGAGKSADAQASGGGK